MGNFDDCENEKRFLFFVLANACKDAMSKNKKRSFEARLWLETEGREMAEILDCDASMSRWLNQLPRVVMPVQLGLALD